ncbi:3-isopropylmalate dehydratase small subunit [Ornithinimicrobium cavernae]|uniref:3-isopropylmalate dehydratase small subunit n=1 Tax=Ornithinimicrobium cavernae TaxID=2666047 RepID=UPI000D692AC7|nr:3-isopropylmalate dehydratase small subunit [Ornithinimicrobium cavernae]
MRAFTVHTGTAAPLRRTNVDTDQIIPVRFLTRSTIAGYGENLFNDWRDDPDFVLNDPRYAAASILVAGNDFGTGSSRESAVWALAGWGFRAVIAPRFGDIFRGNAYQQGLLPVVVPQDCVDALWTLLEREPTAEVTVDLQEREVRAAGIVQAFEVSDDDRWRLLNGLDAVALTLQHEADIAAYEQRRRPALPTTRRPLAEPATGGGHD